jgi:hypothetical protein
MSDGFISYSRKDKEFVRKLHHALERADQDIWVDWQDIPLTADWWKEIQRGVESANNFIAIISPDYVISEVVNAESDDFALAVRSLVQSINTDLEHVSEHTRLL